MRVQIRQEEQFYFARHKLSHQKPKKEKKIGVYRYVNGCHYYTRNTYNFNRHLESCRRFKATRTVLHAIRDVIGEDMFEKGIDQALSDNLNRLGDHYVTTQLEYKARTAVVRHSTRRLFVSRTSTTS